MRCDVCNKPIHQNQRVSVEHHRDGTTIVKHTWHNETPVAPPKR